MPTFFEAFVARSAILNGLLLSECLEQHADAKLIEELEKKDAKLKRMVLGAEQPDAEFEKEVRKSFAFFPTIVKLVPGLHDALTAKKDRVTPLLACLQENASLIPKRYQHFQVVHNAKPEVREKAANLLAALYFLVTEAAKAGEMIAATEEEAKKQLGSKYGIKNE